MINSKIEEVADLCVMMSKESPYTISTSREHFVKTLSSDLLELFTEESEGVTIGFLLGIISERHLIFGDVKYAAEVAWYVHPDYRGTGAAISLLNRFESWARESGCKFITNAGIHNSSFDKVKYMYEKAGYTQVEVAFIKELV